MKLTELEEKQRETAQDLNLLLKTARDSLQEARGIKDLEALGKILRVAMHEIYLIN